MQHVTLISPRSSLMDIIHNPTNTQRLDNNVFSTPVLAYFCLLWVYILCVCCVIDLMPVTWVKYFHYTTQWGFMCERHTWAWGRCEKCFHFSTWEFSLVPSLQHCSPIFIVEFITARCTTQHSAKERERVVGSLKINKRWCWIAENTDRLDVCTCKLSWIIFIALALIISHTPTTTCLKSFFFQRVKHSYARGWMDEKRRKKYDGNIAVDSVSDYTFSPRHSLHSTTIGAQENSQLRCIEQELRALSY